MTATAETAKPKGVRLADPAKLGEAIRVLRERQGIARRALAGKISARTGQPFNTVESQLMRYEGGKIGRFDMPTIRPILAELGYDLALIPREDS